MRFLLKATCAFLLLFGLWYALSGVLLAPVAYLSEAFMRQGFTWADGAQREGIMLALHTKLRIFDNAGRSGTLTVRSNLLVASVSGPLLLAHFLATSGARALWWKVPAGLLLLLPMQAVGVCSNWLFQIAVTHGGSTARGTGFGVVASNLIAHMYLLGNLLLPTLAPVAVWLALSWRQVAPQLAQWPGYGTLDAGNRAHGKP